MPEDFIRMKKERIAETETRRFIKKLPSVTDEGRTGVINPFRYAEIMTGKSMADLHEDKRNQLVADVFGVRDVRELFNTPKSPIFQQVAKPRISAAVRRHVKEPDRSLVLTDPGIAHQVRSRESGTGR